MIQGEVEPGRTVIKRVRRAALFAALSCALFLARSHSSKPHFARPYLSDTTKVLRVRALASQYRYPQMVVSVRAPSLRSLLAFAPNVRSYTLHPAALPASLMLLTPNTPSCPIHALTRCGSGAT